MSIKSYLCWHSAASPSGSQSEGVILGSWWFPPNRSEWFWNSDLGQPLGRCDPVCTIWPTYVLLDIDLQVAHWYLVVSTRNRFFNHITLWLSAFYLILNVAVGGTNGWFPDGSGQKPWFDGSNSKSLFSMTFDIWHLSFILEFPWCWWSSPAAMGDFWRARDQWQSSWSSDPEDRSLVVYVLLLVIPDSLYRISYQLSAIPSRCGSCVDFDSEYSDLRGSDCSHWTWIHHFFSCTWFSEPLGMRVGARDVCQILFNHNASLSWTEVMYPWWTDLVGPWCGLSLRECSI